MPFTPSPSTSNPKWQSVTGGAGAARAHKLISDDGRLNRPHRSGRSIPNLHSMVQDRQHQTVDLPVFPPPRPSKRAQGRLLMAVPTQIVKPGQDIGLPGPLGPGTLFNIRAGPGPRPLSRNYLRSTKSTHTLARTVTSPSPDCQREDTSRIGGSPTASPRMTEARVIKRQGPPAQGRGPKVNFPWLDRTPCRAPVSDDHARFRRREPGVYFMPEGGDEGFALILRARPIRPNRPYVLGCYVERKAAPPSPTHVPKG